jgi:hypothetical protein
MATDAQSLATQANCYMCMGGLSLQQGQRIALLAQISLLKNASNDVTPQGLLTAASCYACFAGLSMYGMMEAVLLKQIAT